LQDLETIGKIIISATIVIILRELRMSQIPDTYVVNAEKENALIIQGKCGK